MAFFIHNPQRRILPQTIEALQRLQDNPQQLDHERDQRYNEPPPPYSESAETTQPPTPGPAPPIVDEYQERYEREIARAKSKPLVQFKSQAKRERERLERQLSEERFGRRQTLPWENSSDLRANSENNVRSRWVEQGIWGDEWGPAWPKGSEPMSKKWTDGHGPFVGPYNPTTTNKSQGARWGHEKYDTDPEPEPELEEPLAPSPLIWGAKITRQSNRPTSPQPIGYIQTFLGPVPKYPIPKPTVRSPEASRPYHQFLSQIPAERDWIQDEIAYKTPGSVVDLDAIAFQSVKDNWIEDGIWDPKWDELPGMTWIHEEPDPDEEEVMEAPTASDHVGEPPPDAADDDRQQSHGPRHHNILGRPAPIPEATNGRADDSPAPAAGGTGISNAERQTGGRMRGVSGRQPVITDVAQDPEETPRRSLRITRSRKAGNRGDPGSSTAEVQVRGNSSAGPAKTPNPPPRGGTRGRRGRSRGDELGEGSKSQELDIGQNLSPSDRGIASASRQPKRGRSHNTTEDSQPLKRPRYNGQDTGLFSHKSSDAANTTLNKGLHDSLTLFTRDMGEARTLAGNKKAALTNPPRRSPRIAERENQLRVAAEVQKQPSTSPPTKTAKRGRPPKTAKEGRPTKAKGGRPTRGGQRGRPKRK